MIKRIVSVVICIGMLIAFAGCGGGSGSGQNDPSKITADVDLTEMSATMVYSEVYNMVMTPDDYDGKVIKMTGVAASYHDDSNNEDYYACIVQDATACCSQGLEYYLIEGQNYPADDKEITVIGTFEKRIVGDGVEYGVISDAQIL